MTRLLPVLLVLAAGCGGHEPPALGGDPERGRHLLRQFACVACHEIPGVAGAQGRVGPPLGGIRERVFLGGVLPNSPENMARFIRSPQAFAPRTAMPAMGLTEGQARDMVAYLHSLE